MRFLRPFWETPALIWWHARQRWPSAWERHIDHCLSCERQPEIGLDTGEICDEGREIAEGLRVRRRLGLATAGLVLASALMAIWERC